MTGPVFYFDINFGKRLPEALSYIKPPVEIRWHSKERFHQAMPDDEWLKIVGQKGWFVFSHDRKFHKELTEAEAIRQHGVGCFYIPGQNLRTWDKMCFIIRNFDKFRALSKSTKRPFVYDFDLRGVVRKMDL